MTNSELLQEVDTLRKRVAKLRQTEKELRESDKKWLSLLNDTPDIVMIVSRDGTIRFINHTLPGITEQEAIGKKVYDYISPEHHEVMRKDLEQVFITGQSSSHEISGVGHHGTLSWYQAQLGPIKQDGRIVAASIITRDITEQKHMERLEQEHRAELAHASRLNLIGEMSSSLAHELNQPLCAISTLARGSLNFMKSGSWDSDELLEAVNQIAGQAERAGEIIRRIGKLVRKQKPNLSSIDIESLIEEAIKMLQSQISIQDVSIERAEPLEKIPLVLADSVEIEQVILNLLQNSLEAMREIHGKKHFITIGVSMNQDCAIEVSVSDTGKGLSAEEIDKVYEPFFTTKSHGLGIGLSISRTIIEAHGGRLWTEQSAAGGATFRFTLPMKGDFHD